ncbi:hypothetical protein J19TS2_49200 [Cohnella xylanilytica]|uniref:DUF6438 domain-containing protein n=1 Tax=Cohnella xylanilytica TaxID=557555 RepID=A0A841TYP3_9BACL|nr:hypothetical protein [Cohnella xylanilytica]MBB6691041.1 hypothetical protein [Cohnella xylanilytica]GIO15365.1 hypothetical protein J19TS2_49200 [Cohnella xylanilytica]
MIEEVQLVYYGAQAGGYLEARLMPRGIFLNDSSLFPGGRMVPLPPREYEDLSTVLQHAPYQAWNDRYEANVTDIPSVRLTILENGQKRTISCDIGEGPEALQRVVRWIQRLVYSVSREHDIEQTRTVAVVASFLGVSETAIVEAVRAGRLRAYIIEESGIGQYRLPVEQFQRLVLGGGTTKRRK